MALSELEKSLGVIEDGGAAADAYEASLLSGNSYTPELPKRKSIFNRVGKTALDLGTGFAKGAIDTVYSVPTNVKKVVVEGTKLSIDKRFQKVREQLNQQNTELLSALKSMSPDDPRYPRVKRALEQNLEQFRNLGKENDNLTRDYLEPDAQGNLKYGMVDDLGSKSIGEDRVVDAIAPKNKAQEVGRTLEKVGELMVPAGYVAKADKVLTGMKVVPDAMRGAKFLNAGARIASKAALEGGTAAASTIAQEGYQGGLDTPEGRSYAYKKAKNNALFAGGAKALLSTGGEILNAVDLPRKLASVTYKADKKDIAKIFENYGEDVTHTVDDSGDTLADWAIKNELKGSVTSQGKQVMRKLAESEKKVMDTAEAAKIRVPVDPGLRSFVDDLAQEYSGYGRGEVSKEIQTFIDDITDDTVSVRSAIKLKRLIDNRLRSGASFRNPRVGDNLAYWADDLRGSINNIDGLGGINKDYAMALKARDALVKKGMSESNKQLLGALEMYTIAQPALEGAQSLSGIGIVAAKRLANSPRFQMAGGRFIQNLGNSTKAGVAARSFLSDMGTSSTGGVAARRAMAEFAQPEPYVDPSLLDYSTAY